MRAAHETYVVASDGRLDALRREVADKDGTLADLRAELSSIARLVGFGWDEGSELRSNTYTQIITF